MSETGGDGDQFARIGHITSLSKSSKEYNFDYSFDDRIPPISNTSLESLALDLQIEPFEFSRSHWAVKEVNLYKVLLIHQNRTANGSLSPKVFSLDDNEQIDNELVSVMMPFDAQFDDVYLTIQKATSNRGMKCLRADDIWEHDHVIQDIVSLVNRSKIVVCDCTGRNPNVFYETGIAHTLGRDVILLTQNKEDIPFDLRHLRYIQYLNNNEGREKLGEALKNRVQTILKQ